MPMHCCRQIHVIYLVNKVVQMFEKYAFVASPRWPINHNKLLLSFHNQIPQE